jgi:ribosomal protein S18 acetylase RimI-like enzyme
MIATDLAVRPATRGDQHQIAELMDYEEHLHRHLDWRAPLDWLGWPHYWVMEDRGRVLAALACPQDPPQVAWIRLFVHSILLTPAEAWTLLWETAREAISSMPARWDSDREPPQPAAVVTVAAIAVKPWFKQLLETSGFTLHQSIVLLEWEGIPVHWDASRTKADLQVRRMARQDLSEVADVDADAFDLLWRNSLEALEKAYSQALYATVADLNGRICGYQISTGNISGGHLGRLAVRRDVQGLGIGRTLVYDLQAWLKARHLDRLTVNTQADNTTSLNLYQRMGFVITGDVFPVLVSNLA